MGEWAASVDNPHTNGIPSLCDSEGPTALGEGS